MILFKEARQLSLHIAQYRQNGKTVAFVPTMGALHQGHLTLISEARKKADRVVSSIFVNPTQFNNADDFSNYPITIEKDIAQLTASGCDVLFLPAATQIYPPGYVAPHYDLGELENVLEGKYRPGHFQGVCQVVDRLLEIVEPDLLFLGQKDFQQCQVIQKLLALTGRTDIILEIVPTVRETDGLAMSSRNLRLSAAQREKATALYAALSKARTEIASKQQDEIKTCVIQSLAKDGFQVDYFEIADAATLHPADEQSKAKIALVAAYLDDIRLIDNLPLN